MKANLEFGVPQLDRVLQGIPRGARILLENDPGVDAEPFLYQSAHAHLARGGTVVYAVLNRAPSSVTRDMTEFGFDPATDANRLLFYDGFSKLMGTSEDAPFEPDDPSDPREFADLLQLIAEEHPDAVLLVDSLSTLVDHSGVKRFVAAFPALGKALQSFRLSIALHTRWPYEEALDEALSTFDAAVHLKGVEERVLFSQYFSLRRANWIPTADHTPRLYKTVRPGGVFVYIPKIAVVGPYNAGKSTFVHAVSDRAVSVDRLGTTVALDHGHCTIDGLTADLFGMPGQSRFDPILKTIASQALGVILVVDATKPTSFERALELMQKTWKQGLPIIVAANKQDLPGALSPEDVAARLSVPAHVRVMGCVGTDRSAAQHVLSALIDQILLKGVPIER